ncbi:MAG TPA: thioredoxin domain-containing protein [Gemmatimonadaceae bacterium]|jgi:hypothetical protein
MDTTLDRVLTITLTVAAVGLVGIAIHREFSGASAKPGPSVPVEALKRESSWKKLRDASVAIGDSVASVEIVVFTDFECPACQEFHKRVMHLKQKEPSAFALRMVHYPLAMHRFANAAARAADCAARQSRLSSMYDLLFAKQDSFGLKEWTAYARDAGITDTAAFARCVRDENSHTAIEGGRQLGQALAIEGTPTVLLVVGGSRGHPMTRNCSEPSMHCAPARILLDSEPASPMKYDEGDADHELVGE